MSARAASELPNSRPAETIPEAVRQARAALRRFREARASGEFVPADPGAPICARIQLPLPHPGAEDRIQLLDESEFPGGVLQVFRKLRPLVEDLLLGYDAEFVGMLESDADGVGVWRCQDMTVVVNVNNQTFAPFARLCDGDFGGRPTEAGHLVIAVNCAWTSAADIGQFWDRDLKARARRLIEERPWLDLYHLFALRTAGGATAWLYHTWGEPWKLYHSPDTDAGAECGELIKAFAGPWAAGAQHLRPDAGEVASLMAEAQRDYAARQPRKRGVRLW